MRFFEDFEIGDVFNYGHERVDKAEMLSFARAYDPQPFHVDEAAARASIYGGITSSGIFTAALFSRMMTRQFEDVAAQGSPGWEELNWRIPVLAGDELSVRSEVIYKRPSASRPQLGILKLSNAVSNQRDQVAMNVVHIWLVSRRAE